jgi:flagellar FliL protein
MSKKMLIIIGGVFFLMMTMMGGGFLILWKQMSNTVVQVQQQNEETEAEEAPQEEEEVIIGPMYKMDTMIVNLADKGGKRYLRTTMQLELNSAEVLEEIEQRLAQLRDAVLMILPSKQYSEISTTEGKIALRDEIIAKMNTILKKGQVSTIYFTEFVVQ